MRFPFPLRCTSFYVPILTDELARRGDPHDLLMRCWKERGWVICGDILAQKGQQIGTAMILNNASPTSSPTTDFFAHTVILLRIIHGSAGGKAMEVGTGRAIYELRRLWNLLRSGLQLYRGISRRSQRDNCRKQPWRLKNSAFSQNVYGIGEGRYRCR